jgi:hypothetical protein
MTDPPCTCGHGAERHTGNEGSPIGCKDCGCQVYEPDAGFMECGTAGMPDRRAGTPS